MTRNRKLLLTLFQLWDSNDNKHYIHCHENRICFANPVTISILPCAKAMQRTAVYIYCRTRDSCVKERHETSMKTGKGNREAKTQFS